MTANMTGLDEIAKRSIATPDDGRALPPLLVFADDWGRHPSSCQHLIRRLREHTRVLWVNTIGTRQVRADRFTANRAVEKIRNWANGLQQVARQMWVLDVPMIPGFASDFIRGMNRVVMASWIRRTMSRLGMSRPIVMTTLPYILWLVKDLPRSGLIYYCTDDYSHWTSADRETLQNADRELSRVADVILAASRTLQEKHEGFGDCRYFPHGVDFDHFATARNRQAIPVNISALPGPRIGYFGLVYEKLDFELLAAIARRFQPGSLVLLGPITYCPPEFKQIPNVHCLGPQPYERLPGCLAGLDVLLMPYRADDPMIIQSGPLKLRECLATGKPTVAIDIADIRAFQPHVRIGKNHSQYLEQIADALSEDSSDARAPARQQAVTNDGWDSRSLQLLNLMNEMSSKRNHRNGSSGSGGRKQSHLA